MSVPSPLTRARTGAVLRVTGISAADPRRSDRLAALGLTIGARVRVRQRFPAYVLEIGETTLALDGELASAIEVEET